MTGALSPCRNMRSATRTIHLRDYMLTCFVEMVEAEEEREKERKARASGQEKKAKGHGDEADKKDESARKGSNQNEKDSSKA
jgi:hypothetical protein